MGARDSGERGNQARITEEGTKTKREERKGTKRKSTLKQQKIKQETNNSSTLPIGEDALFSAHRTASSP